MKKRLIAAAIAAMLCTATAHAQWVVVDPTNLVQNTLTAIRTLEQINNQIQQLQNEAQMLMNQARNLASLPSSVVGHLRANLATTERLIAQAQGLAYDVTNLDREFQRLYPEQYAATVSGDQMYRDTQERWKNTLHGLQTTMQMQAQVSQNLGVPAVWLRPAAVGGCVGRRSVPAPHAARAVPRGRARRRILRAGGASRPSALSLRPCPAGRVPDADRPAADSAQLR